MKILIGLKSRSSCIEIQSNTIEIGFGFDYLQIPVKEIHRDLEKYNIGNVFASEEKMLSIPTNDLHYLFCGDIK